MSPLGNSPRYGTDHPIMQVCTSAGTGTEPCIGKSRRRSSKPTQSFVLPRSRLHSSPSSRSGSRITRHGERKAVTASKSIYQLAGGCMVEYLELQVNAKPTSIVVCNACFRPHILRTRSLSFPPINTVTARFHLHTRTTRAYHIGRDNKPHVCLPIDQMRRHTWRPTFYRQYLKRHL